MSMDFTSVLGSNAAASLRASLIFQSTASVLQGAFSSGPASAYEFPVLDQLELTSLTQAGLADLYGKVIDKPLSNSDLANSIWENAGWNNQSWGNGFMPTGYGSYGQPIGDSAGFDFGFASLGSLFNAFG